MAKIIKLSLTDIENIVKNTINEAEFDDFDTKTQPEELPDAQNYEDEEKIKKTMAIGRGEDGKIYVTDVETGDILGVK